MKPILEQAGLFACPLCKSLLEAGETSLRCQRGHDFALSKKGYADFCPAARSGAYDDALFESRSRFIAGGFYQEALDAISGLLARYAPQGPLLDAGCGEGSFLKALIPDPASRTALGLDLSRPGIQRASRGGGGWLWAVGDLSRLPLRNGAMAAIVNILSPANYPEFSRALGPGGVVIKAVPEAGYLAELRALLKNQLRSEVYSNERVVNLFSERFNLLASQELSATLPLSPDQARDLVAMTPLTQRVDKGALNLSFLTHITIHLRLLVGAQK